MLNVSDFHGQLDPLNVNGVDLGGAAALSSYWAADRAANPNTLLVTAGDAVGASPPLSSFFDDPRTMDSMNYARFDADTLGNHNCDKGLNHLQAHIHRAKWGPSCLTKHRSVAPRMPTLVPTRGLSRD